MAILIGTFCLLGLRGSGCGLDGSQAPRSFGQKRGGGHGGHYRALELGTFLPHSRILAEVTLPWFTKPLVRCSMRQAECEEVHRKGQRSWPYGLSV